jgi:glycine/D-amino acid oxidase-like deaminating enzyme
MKYAVYWRDTEPYMPGPPLAEHVECDVVMIGGGYTALWTSHFLKQLEPNLSIRIVEAEFVGAGASGHNDGFVTPAIGHSLRTVVNAFGIDRARAAYSAVGRSIIELVRFIGKHGIDAELEPRGFFLVATSPGQRRRLEADIELAARFGGVQPPQLIDRDEIQRRIRSPVLIHAIESGGALINPFKFVRGLARVVKAQGVPIHEQTKALEVLKGSDGYTVVTPRGRVRARRVVFATNAYQHQYSQFRRQVIPVWSYVLVSQPLGARQMERLSWPGREGFVEARNFIVFARLTQDNRILIGGGPAPYYFGRSMSDAVHLDNRQSQKFLRQQAIRFFPALTHLEWEYAYGGCMAMTRDLVPQVGSLGDNVFYGHGYCGNGIATTHTVGKVLRDLILRKESIYSKLFFVRERPPPRFPSEPFAYAGVRGISLLLAAQDRNPSLLRWPLI